MKKAASFLLALLLVLPLNQSLGQNADLQSEPMGRVMSIAHLNENIYILAQAGLFLWDTALDEQKALTIIPLLSNEVNQNSPTGPLDVLFSHKGALWGLSNSTGQVYELVIDKTKDSITLKEHILLNWQPMAMEEPLPGQKAKLIKSAAAWQGQLLLLVHDYSISDIERYEVVLYNLTTGAGQVLPIANIQAIAPYNDEGFLAIQWNRQEWATARETDENQQKIMPLLGVINSKEEAFTALAILAFDKIQGLAYDEMNQALYFTADNKLMKWTPQTGAVQTNYFSVQMGPFSPAGVVTTKGIYAFIGGENTLYSTAIKSRDNSAPLVISGLYANPDSEDIISFQKARPDIPLTFVEESDATLSPGQKILLGDEEIDVYSLDLTFGDFVTMKNKGFLYDLSQSPLLAGEVDKMYPKVKELVTDEGGRLLAFPTHIIITVKGYVQPVFEQMGLKVPDTWKELMALYAWWGEIYGSTTGEDFYLEGKSYTKDNPADEAFFADMVKAYIEQQLLNQGTLRFDTPVFRQLVKDFENYRPKIALIIDPEGRKSYSTNKEGYFPILIEPSFFISPSDLDLYERFTFPLSLQMEEGAAPILSARLHGYVINPHSRQKELALVFVETLSQNPSPFTAVGLYPDENEPIEDELWLKWIAETQANLAAAEKALADAPHEEIKALEEQIAFMQNNLATMEIVETRWLISPRAIDTYRHFDGAWQFIGHNPITYGSNLHLYLEQEQQRYLQGEITLEDFIRHMDERLTMVELEEE